MKMSAQNLSRVAAGRTDLVVEHLSAGGDALARDEAGTSLLSWCAYYGDVSAIRMLLAAGESLGSLGADFGLSGAAFHGHWRLCQFLLEHDAPANYQLPDSLETPLHSALCTDDRLAYDPVVRILLAAGAKPNAVTAPGAETGSFMRDCRTYAESPLHRAAAFGTEETIQMLLDAGADRELRDMRGDTPLSWASWYRRPPAVLRLLTFGPHKIHPRNRSMRANLIGDPVLPAK
jgi:ankyrin repeat protein